MYSTVMRVKDKETGDLTETIRCSYCFKETKNEQIIQRFKESRKRMVG